MGDKCDSIYYIFQGVLDIVISDGYLHHKVLDVLGKGSFIGMNFVLKNEMWFYKAMNNSTITSRILKIKLSVIENLASQFAELDDAITHHKEQLEVYGLHQIDYKIRMLRTSNEEIQDLVVNFQKEQIWKERRFDFVTQWLEIEQVDNTTSNMLNNARDEIFQSIE